jgi:hypothetical protein
MAQEATEDLGRPPGALIAMPHPVQGEADDQAPNFWASRGSRKRLGKKPGWSYGERMQRFRLMPSLKLRHNLIQPEFLHRVMLPKP